MSAPQQAPLMGMRLFEARRILRHPKFGDERSIEAHKLLLLAIDVMDARYEHNYCTCSSCRPIPLYRMTAEELQEELIFWKESAELPECV